MIEKAFRYFDTDAIKLAVLSENTTVYNLYKSIGFVVFDESYRVDSNDNSKKLLLMKLERDCSEFCVRNL
jgi:ribosomal protein S18 acetylase RimI-like enzyme